jgi:hypothetical protein
MKILIYIKLVVLLFFVCNSSSKKIEKFSIRINYVGDIDKPLPTINFFDTCEESFKSFNYNYTLKYGSYLKIKNEIQNGNSRTKGNSSLICILLNNKQSYYLNKESSLLFISHLLNVTMYKNNEQLKNQLNLYLRVLKSRR